MWVGCYCHCSLEQVEAFDVQTANAESCFEAPADTADGPCDICGFMAIGGATTISQFSLTIPLSDFESNIDKFMSMLSIVTATDQDSSPPGANLATGDLRALCEDLVLTGLPVRGPTST